MEKYKNNLEEFIANIQNQNITKNEVIVGELSREVVVFLKSKSIEVSSRYIYLNVRAYRHIIRDFKKKLGKAIPDEAIKEMYKSLNSPHKVIFDAQKKHCNLIYIDSNYELLFKIVVQPNYSSKLGSINAIVTAGIIYEDTLKSKYYEIITEHGWESNPR